MSESSNAGLAPVRGKARIDVLDILRGLAILGILFINVPYMAAPVWQFSSDIRSIGWTPADQGAWAAVTLLLAGTQRCLLQFLFGAGMMVLARKAMTPDGPVAVSDLYYRRNLWLLAFGLFDVFVLLWPGDILHIYALAALFVFPFRNLAPRFLLAIGLGWALLFAVGIPDYGAREFAARTELVHQVDAGDARARAEWQRLSVPRPGAEVQHHIAVERAAHAGPALSYAEESWRYWSYLAQNWLLWDVIEAFCTMLIGVALWKWRVIQGGRSTRFYLGMTLAAYGFGLTARLIGLSEVLSFGAGPKTIWITGEFARLAVGLGHLGLINLAVRSRIGTVLLEPFKAAGRMAFSLYFLQQFVGMYILFSPFGFNLWGRFGWAEMAGIAVIGTVAQLVIANLWFRWFASGPLEWLWRSMAYVKWQPLWRQDLNAPPRPDPALPSGPSAVAAE